MTARTRANQTGAAAWLAALALYAALALLLTWPMPQDPAGAFLGAAFSDVHEYARQIWWLGYAPFHGLPLYDQPWLAYPDGTTGAVLWASPLQSLPAVLYAWVLPLPAAYNLMVFVRLVLNGVAAWWAFRRVFALQTGAAPPVGAGWVAGAVFMLAPVLQGHMLGGHSGLLFVWPLPLLAWALLRLRERGGARAILLAAALLPLAVAGNSTLAVYGVLPIALAVTVGALARRDFAHLRRLAVVGAAGGALMLVLLGPLALEQALRPPNPLDAQDVAYSADLLALGTPSFQHPLWGRLSHTHRVLGINLVEGAGYVGLLAGALAMVGVWRWRAAHGWLGLLLLCWVFSLGPLLKVYDSVLTLDVGGYRVPFTLPWALLGELPLVSMARTPARFNIPLALTLSVLAGYGAAALLPRARRLAPALALALIGLHALDVHLSWGTRGLPSAALLADIAFDPALCGLPAPHSGALFSVPWQNRLAAQEALYAQTWLHTSLIAGHVARGTTASHHKLRLLEANLDPALLRAAHAEWVLLSVQQDADGVLAARARAQLDTPCHDAPQYALFRVPDDAPDAPFTWQQPALTTPDATPLDLYAPGPGWAVISGRVHGDDVPAHITLNGVPHAHAVASADGTPLTVALPLSQAGFYDVVLAADTPCPRHFDATLACRGVGWQDLTVRYTPGGVFTPLAWARDIVLGGWHMPEVAAPGQPLDVLLAWQFDAPLPGDLVRFVVLVGADGAPLAQQDAPLGPRRAGDVLGEVLSLAVPADAAPGAAALYVGWYTYPDVARLPLLSDVPGALDGWAQLGTVVIAPDGVPGTR